MACTVINVLARRDIRVLERAARCADLRREHGRAADERSGLQSVTIDRELDFSPAPAGMTTDPRISAIRTKSTVKSTPVRSSPALRLIFVAFAVDATRDRTPAPSRTSRDDQVEMTAAESPQTCLCDAADRGSLRRFPRPTSPEHRTWWRSRARPPRRDTRRAADRRCDTHRGRQSSPAPPVRRSKTFRLAARGTRKSVCSRPARRSRRGWRRQSRRRERASAGRSSVHRL